MKSLLDKLSGTHITILALAAMSVPSALGAAVVYQAVGIVDPTTGTKALVDAGRRLYVHDPIAGFANNPYNTVNLVHSVSSDGKTTAVYTPPAGKALIIKSVQFNYYNNSLLDEIYLSLNNPYGNSLAMIRAHDKAGSLSSVYEPGIVLRSGQQLSSIFGTSNPSVTKYALLYVQGYLIPANSLPAPSSAEAAEQFVLSSANEKPNAKH